MKSVIHSFHANKKVRDKDIEGHLKTQVKKYTEVLFASHPDAESIAYATLTRSLRHWKLEFYIHIV